MAELEIVRTKERVRVLEEVVKQQPEALKEGSRLLVKCRPIRSPPSCRKTCLETHLTRELALQSAHIMCPHRTLFQIGMNFSLQLSTGKHIFPMVKGGDTCHVMKEFSISLSDRVGTLFRIREES